MKLKNNGGGRKGTSWGGKTKEKRGAKEVDGGEEARWRREKRRGKGRPGEKGRKGKERAGRGVL